MSRISATPCPLHAAATAKAHPAAAPKPGPWRSGPGYGIFSRDMHNPKGNGIFIGYAGYQVTPGESRAWVDKLYQSDLKRLGVRYVYAVQGPQDPSYAAQEIGNSHLARVLTQQGKKAPYILVVGHSSGSFVADELLHQLANGADPKGVTRNKVVFFNLDGGQEFDASGIRRTRRTYYVSAHDHRTGTVSPNWDTMQALGSEFRGKGGFFEYNCTRLGLAPGAVWALHTSLINSRPHSRFTGSPTDYGDFSGGRTAEHAWLDAKLKDARIS